MELSAGLRRNNYLTDPGCVYVWLSGQNVIFLPIEALKIKIQIWSKKTNVSVMERAVKIWASDHFLSRIQFSPSILSFDKINFH